MNPDRPGGAVLLSVQQDIAAMRTRGAGEIGKQAANALATAAEAYRGGNLQQFRDEMLAAARLLASARPTAVSLRNALNFVLAETLKEPSLGAAKERARQRADQFAARVNDAKARIAGLGAGLLKSGRPVLTHCHSTVAAGVLVEANKRGKEIPVFATETRPFRQGLITSRLLHDQGVDVTLVVDSAALHVLETQRVQAVVVGADAIGADGSLYNKIGTRLITLAARSLKIPVYACAESYKFSPYTLQGEEVEIEERDPAEVVKPEELPGVRIHNPVFDRTPPRQITQYVTDRGLLSPRGVATFIRKEFGASQRWI